MKRLLFVLVFVYSIFFHTNAQIKGVVVDEQGQPVEFANVALYLLPDSTLKSGTVRTLTGNFHFLPIQLQTPACRFLLLVIKRKPYPYHRNKL